jgi:hypothetical protein
VPARKATPPSVIRPAVDRRERKIAPEGIIIYIKPACYGNEPRDIYEYFKRSETFPHESTADQFFSESQFESYRMLGLYTMQNLCKKSVKDFPDFIEEIQKHVVEAPALPQQRDASVAEENAEQKAS